MFCFASLVSASYANNAAVRFPWLFHGRLGNIHHRLQLLDIALGCLPLTLGWFTES